MSSLTLKEEGNEKFKAGQYEDALACYTSALELSDVKDSEKANLYKNRAMCYLKINKYEEAVQDSTQGTILFQFQHSAGLHDLVDKNADSNFYCTQNSGVLAVLSAKLG